MNILYDPLLFVLLSLVVVGGAVVGLRLLPVHHRILVPLVLVFVIPADQISVLAGDRQGSFVLAVVVIAVCASITRVRRIILVRSDWDIQFLLVASLALRAIHAEMGRVRSILFWCIAGFVLLWIRSEGASPDTVRRQILNALLLSGSITATVAIFARLGLGDVANMFPGYEPVIGELSIAGSVRSVGVSGHALRLGTLCMLSTLVALSRLYEDNVSRIGRAMMVTLGCLSMGGLILSAARGSWLGFVAGATFSIVWGTYRGHWQRSMWVGIALVVVIGAVWVVGGGTIVMDRLFGESVAQGSLDQRREAIEAVRHVWTRSPIIGVGMGGVEDAVRSVGMSVPDIENEYLIGLVATGIIGLISLVGCVMRRAWLGLAERGGRSSQSALAAILGIGVNLGTYNLFAWSAGPSLLISIACLCL